MIHFELIARSNKLNENNTLGIGSATVTTKCCVVGYQKGTTQSDFRFPGVLDFYINAGWWTVDKRCWGL